MAIAITEPVGELISTNNGTTYNTGSFTPTANSLLVMLVFATGTVAAGAASGGGWTWTRVGSQLYNTVDTAYAFIAQVGSSVAAMNPTFTCAGDTATGAILCVFQVTGHNSYDPIRQVVPAAGTTANPSFTTTACDTNNGYIAGFGINRSPVTSAPPNVSWTETVDGSVGTPNQGASAAFRAGGETGTTYTFTTAAGNWGGFFLEINEASLGQSPVDPMGMAGIFGV